MEGARRYAGGGGRMNGKLRRRVVRARAAEVGLEDVSPPRGSVVDAPSRRVSIDANVLIDESSAIAPASAFRSI